MDVRFIVGYHRCDCNSVNNYKETYWELKKALEEYERIRTEGCKRCGKGHIFIKVVEWKRSRNKEILLDSDLL